MSVIKKWGALCLLVASQAVFAAGPLWLSDTPPGGGSRGGGGHSHGGSERGARGKELWLRSGAPLSIAPYATADGEVDGMLFEPGRQLSWFVPETAANATRLTVPAQDEGFYNVYLTRRAVENGVLEVTVAKAELLNHSCRNGHDDVAAKMKVKYLEQTPLEIVRERMPKENLHGRVGYGDRIQFRVMASGQPVAGVEVTLHTESGWRNSAVSDAEGLVGFTMIRDYFPDWSDFDAGRRQQFLATAVMERNESGTWNGRPYSGVRYLATLPGGYFPSSRDYHSYAYGLLIGLFALTFTGVAVYLYRRRRGRPLREVRFHE
jgi:hypothetical protein